MAYSTVEKQRAYSRQWNASRSEEWRAQKNAARRDWYQRNKQHALQYSMDYKATRQEIVRRAKDQPCTDCKQRYPACVMDFDHLNPEDKLYPISTAAGSLSVDRLLAEIAKCEVVCANCHRIRTHLGDDNDDN